MKSPPRKGSVQNAAVKGRRHRLKRLSHGDRPNCRIIKNDTYSNLPLNCLQSSGNFHLRTFQKRMVGRWQRQNENFTGLPNLKIRRRRRRWRRRRGRLEHYFLRLLINIIGPWWVINSIKSEFKFQIWSYSLHNSEKIKKKGESKENSSPFSVSSLEFKRHFFLWGGRCGLLRESRKRVVPPNSTVWNY